MTVPWKGLRSVRNVGQLAEIVQRLEEPDDKLQDEAGNAGKQRRNTVERAVERGILDLVDEGI